MTEDKSKTLLSSLPSQVCVLFEGDDASMAEEKCKQVARDIAHSLTIPLLSFNEQDVQYRMHSRDQKDEASFTLDSFHDIYSF